MYDPIRNKSHKEYDNNQQNVEDGDKCDDTNTTEVNNALWIDEEDRIANFYITTNPDYDLIRLPKIIKIKDPQPGEVPIFVKRSYPRKEKTMILIGTFSLN